MGAPLYLNSKFRLSNSARSQRITGSREIRARAGCGRKRRKVREERREREANHGSRVTAGSLPLSSGSARRMQYAASGLQAARRDKPPTISTTLQVNINHLAWVISLHNVCSSFLPKHADRAPRRRSDSSAPQSQRKKKARHTVTMPAWQRRRHPQCER